MQINKPGRKTVARKAEANIFIVAVKGSGSKQPPPMEIKDVSFDSSLKTNIHWAALFGRALKKGDFNLKSGPFESGSVDEIKSTKSSD